MPIDPSSSRTALGHLTVLDLTRVLAGPWCTQTLADLGATVIKVERPKPTPASPEPNQRKDPGGDDTRQWGPPFLKTHSGSDSEDSAYFLAANRNKRSIAVDLSHPEGQALIRRMVAQADVVVENYKVGQLARYGLDEASLRAIKPDLIYCSITGFGQTGPWAHRAGYDFIVQGIGGLMSITGQADNQPGGGPQKVGVAVSDLMTGLYSTIAILAALAHRDRTGEGQAIDMALLDVQVAMLANMATNYLASGKPPKRWGNAHPNIVPYQAFEASDAWIIVATGNDAQYRKFVTAGGRPDLADDERFARNADRVRLREHLVPELEAMVKQRSSSFWIAALEAAGVPCGPIHSIDQVFDHPQVKAREMSVAIDRDDATAHLVASPIKLSATPVRYDRAPPRLAADSIEVLTWAGLSPAEIETLQASGALGGL